MYKVLEILQGMHPTNRKPMPWVVQQKPPSVLDAKQVNKWMDKVNFVSGVTTTMASLKDGNKQIQCQFHPLKPE